MRGRWDLNETELAYWQANCIGQTQMMKQDKLDIIDLSREDITPYQVNQVLESLGWEHYNEYGDYEGGRYCFYRKEDCRDIVLYASILTFECAIYLKERMNDVSFKKQHIKDMLGIN